MSHDAPLPQIVPVPDDDAIALAGEASNGDLILAIVCDLLAKQERLSGRIDEYLADGSLPVSDLARLLAIHSQNASRLGRLLRDKRALSDRAADAMSEAIDRALDELSAEWEIEL
jgi:hypothetical protein